ncbi:MAG: decaprenylphospho-beta-D-erythro-pentofuranosid-2-ulose 2-reductase [Acidimicrobiales bacterium]
MRDALGSPQSVLVLGGGSDIARCVARELVARRARTVVLAGRRPEALEPARSELLALGAHRVDTVAFDADDVASHRRVIEEVHARHGDMDLTLIAFGVLGDQATDEHDPAAAAAVLRTNFVGAASVGVVVAERLRRQGHGTLAVISSVAGERARRSNFVYGSSKAGLDAFFQGLGHSLAGSGARVLIVRPGFVRTKMTAGRPSPPGPLATTPERVAQVVVRALETGAEEVWAPAALRPVMSVLRHLPTPLFRRLPL